MKEKTKGAGDKIEEIIHKVAPKLADKQCKGCQKRKAWFNNNINAKFG